MPLVVISAKYLVKPAMCVCCGGPSSLEIPDNAGHKGNRNDKTLSFPACTMCATHFTHEAARLGFVPGYDAKAPPPSRSANCEADGRLFDYVSWSGTENTILFASPRYARAFVHENRAANKNVVTYDESPEQIPSWPEQAARSKPLTLKGAALALFIIGVFVTICVVAGREEPPAPGAVPIVYRTSADPPVASPTPGTPPAPEQSGRHRHGERRRH